MKIRGITTLKKIYGHIRMTIKKLSFIGKQRYCPICGKYSKKFDVYGVRQRPDACCIHCGSLERHRLVWMYINGQTDLLNGSPKSMLHIAPEPCLEMKFKTILRDGYITADLNRPDVRVKMDVTSIPFADNTYDMIYCSHVLEHVPDDRKALRELCRVLKPTGWMLLLIPINVEKTVEDPSITDPQKRLELFGQDDHVRRYGPDVLERIREAGFKVKKVLPGDFLTAEQIVQYATTDDTPLFYCTK